MLARILIPCLAFVGLMGCSGGGGTSGTGSSGSGGAGGSSNLQHLYVASEFDNAVYVYTIQQDGSITGPDRTLAGPKTTIAAPTSVAVDDSGTLYVVNQFRDVTVYAPGASGDTAPVETLFAGLSPNYVSYKAGAVITYPNHDGSDATVRISDPGVPNAIPPYSEPFAFAFASYVVPILGVGGNVLAFTGYLCTFVQNPADTFGSVRCLTVPVTFSSDFSDPSAQIVNCNVECEALDPVNFGVGSATDLKFHNDGRLTTAALRTFSNPGPSIDTYDVGNPTPLTSISGSNTLLLDPTAIAFDANDNIYVADAGFASGNASVHVYAHDADANVPPIHNLTGLNGVFGIAIGP